MRLEGGWRQTKRRATGKRNQWTCAFKTEDSEPCGENKQKNEVRRFQGTFGLEVGLPRLEEGHGEVGSDPGAEGGEEDVDPVLGVADDGEGGEQVPDAAPGGGGDAAAGGDGGVEEDVDGVGGRSGDENALRLIRDRDEALRVLLLRMRFERSDFEIVIQSML